jgi:hypothetical protein
MNENDRDRYYWRTGQRWSGDYRSQVELRGPVAKVPRWAVAVLLASFLATTVALFVQR